MTDDAPMSFRCRHCDTRIAVNAPMRLRLIERGCVICQKSVGIDDFVMREE